MYPHRTYLLIGLFSILCLIPAQRARAVHQNVQQHCVNDYKKFCSQWGIETKGLRNCMHKQGDKLTHACVAALVKHGEVSQAEVNRRKKAAGH